mgnify:CR=1 FL=1
MLLLGVACGIVGAMAREAKRQRGVASVLRAAGASVWTADSKWLPEVIDTRYASRIRRIETYGTQFDGKGLTSLQPLLEFENLRELYFYNEPITDISPLAELQNLEHIFLRCPRVTDVSPLGGLKNLKTLQLHPDRQFGNDQIEELRHALPKCEVLY